MQILQRERNPTEDQRIKAPLQNFMMDKYEGDYQEDGEDNIHCVGEETRKSYLTQHDYEEALMTEQTEENYADDGIFSTEEKNRYNLRSKSDTAHQNAPASPKNSTASIKKKDQTSENQQTDPSKANTSIPPKKTIVPVGKCLPSSVCLSLMASTTVEMAG
jgi:hypothetical protein